MRWLILVLSLVAGPVSAEICDELWYARNQIFDRAGYCFGSNLGQAVFDNIDCTTKSPALSAEAGESIALIKEIEEEFACKVDTKRTLIEVSLPYVLPFVTDTPIPHGYDGLGCLGWVGDPVTLFAAIGNQGEVLGSIEPGDTVNQKHISVGAWNFVTVSRDGEDLAGGWTDVEFTEAVCSGLAG